MPSPIRIYFPFTADVSGLACIEGDEHHYLSRVHRARVGDQVILFGLDSSERMGIIERLDREKTTLRVISVHESRTEPGMEITLAIAVGKGRKLEEIVETTTVLGVSRIIPFISARSVAKRSNPDLVVRLQKIAIEACRQSRRVQVPELGGVKTGLEDALVDVLKRKNQLLFLDEAGGMDLVERALEVDKQKPVVLFIGPEGGWDDLERNSLLEKGAIPTSLGPRILRTELAPIVAVSILERIIAYRSLRS